MTDQLPATIPAGALMTATDTYIVPALIADAGEQASWRYVEFFTANINNDHTRRAYGPAAGSSPGARTAASRSPAFGRSTWPPG
jgi:hypothetical protein